VARAKLENTSVDRLLYTEFCDKVTLIAHTEGQDQHDRRGQAAFPAHKPEAESKVPDKVLVAHGNSLEAIGVEPRRPRHACLAGLGRLIVQLLDENDMVCPREIDTGQTRSAADSRTRPFRRSIGGWQAPFKGEVRSRPASRWPLHLEHGSRRPCETFAMRHP
jgi:hypothetical protein